MITRDRIAALVVAAGSSRRLGQPKQLLPYGDSTLLGTTLSTVRSFGFRRNLVTVGGAADKVRDTVDSSGFDVVTSVHHTEGCSSSIVSAVTALQEADGGGDIEGLFLFLGDQPHVTRDAVAALEAVTEAAPLGLVDYRNGLGHPFWFDRSLFGALGELQGDKAVWKLVESGRWPVVQVEVNDDVPLDVDTWDDYERLVASTSDA